MSNIDPLLNSRIGVATSYGKPYYRFSTYLKALKLSFDSILPEEIIHYDGDIVFSTYSDSPQSDKIPILYDDITENLPTVIRGKILQKLNPNFEEENILIGIDPGKRIGLSIFYYGKEIESSFFPSIEKLVFHIVSVLAGLRAKRKIVRIGNGDMIMAKQIVQMLNLQYCSSFEIEFVDEKNTSVKIKDRKSTRLNSSHSSVSRMPSSA